MSKKNVYLSAGHCGSKENGARSEWIDERIEAYALMYDVTTRMKSTLNLLRAPWNVGNLRFRINEANAFCGVKSGVAVELHFNAAGGTGCEAVISDNASELSKKLAFDLAKLTSDCLGLRNRGVKTESQRYGRRSRLAFVSDTTCPAVILEVCFLDSESDCKAYFEHKLELAKALAEYFDKL